MKSLLLSKSLVISFLQFFISLCILFVAVSCEKDETTSDEVAQEETTEDPDTESTDEDDDTDDTTSGEEQSNDCPDALGFVFEENDGIVSIEFENNDFLDGWVLKNDASDTSGDGYMQWEGNASLGNPGNGMVVFPIRISTAGTYQFLWHSSYRKGNNGTEHNDSWLRFSDADDFFGRKGNGSIVYPKGSGKEPNPNGSSSDGWFKIYRSGNDNAFKWQASTSDNDAHDVFVTFSSPGVFLLEVSARSDFHAIDRMLLFQEDINKNDAIEAAAVFSQKTTCD